MTEILFLIFVFGALFYAFNELEDECMHNTWIHHKKFLNSRLSWKNKWKVDKNGSLIINHEKKWYYFGINPSFKEKFLYSSTALVFLTDGEHLFQWIKKRAIDAGFLIIDWRYFIAWEIGTIIMGIIKEKFLKNIQ